MAYIIGDSFDPYLAITDASSNYWETSAAWVISSTTRFGTGQSLSTTTSNSTQLSKTIPSGGTESTLFAAFAFRFNGAFTGSTDNAGIQFLDSGTAQVTILFRSDGAIVVRSGSRSGTTIATFNAAFSANVWTHFQIKTVIHNTAGSVEIRLNGNTSDDFSATNINTRGGTSNNYATQVAVVTSSMSGVSNIFDDLMFYSSSGAAPNDWIGDIRATWLAPTADTAQKQFTASPTSSTNFGTQAQSSTNTLSITAGQIRTSAIITTPVGGTLGKATVNFNAGFTGKAKVGLYDSDGTASAPGTLLATSNEVTNPVTGTNDFTFASPPLLTINHQYYLALITDTNCTLKAGTAATSYTQTQAYASGFPSTMAGASGSANQAVMFGTITATNSGCVQELIEDGATTYVFDSTAGHFDLYDFADLATTPAAIVGVNVRSFGAKSDAGARSGTVRVKSGATSQDGATLALSTSFQNIPLWLPTDPNTSAAWTAAAVNALQAGPKTVS